MKDTKRKLSILTPSPDIVADISPQKNCHALELSLGVLANKELGFSATNFTGIFFVLRTQRKNPHIKKVHKKSLQWALHYHLVDKAHLKELDEAKFASLVATPIAELTEKDLQILTDFTTCFFLIDDIVEKILHNSQVTEYELINVLNLFVNLLRGKYKNIEDIPIHSFPFYQNFCMAIFNISQRLQGKKINLNEFIDSVEEYLVGCFWEAAESHLTLLSENNYLYNRKFTIATRTVFEFSCLLKGISIPKKTRTNPFLTRSIVAALNIIIILNDIASFYKDIHGGDKQNLVLIKFQEFKKIAGCTNPLQEAFSYCFDLYHKELRDFIKIEAGLSRSLHAKQYYAIIKDCLVDNVHWHFRESKRYRIPNLRYEEVPIDDLLEKI